MFDHNANQPDTSHPSHSSNPIEQSGQSGQPQDPLSAFGALDQNQRMQVAQAFILRFAETNDLQARQYAMLDPHTVTPSQLAEMHQYSAEHQPQILSGVLQSSVMTRYLGDWAASELDKQRTAGR